MSKVTIKLHSNEIYLFTEDFYAMDLGIELLHLLDDRDGIFVKNTGWKNNYGLPVAESLPIISSRALAAEIETDGSEFLIRMTRGTQEDFGELYDLIKNYLDEKRLL